MAKQMTRTGPSLVGQVAIVAGSTRGAGRGIARALGEAGAIVYCTGRSTPGQPSPYGRRETIDETAAMIIAAGGRAVAVRVDHTQEAEVEALVARVIKKHRRLDVLVNSIAGEEPQMGQYAPCWQVDLTHADLVLRQALVSHILTAKHAADAMIRQKRGLIVEVTESDTIGAGGNPIAWSVKLALKGLALNMASELCEHGVTAVAITPGFLRSEAMLEGFGVTEDTWRDAGAKDSNFLESETPLFVGRAVVALAADPHVLQRTGHLWSSWELSRDYQFTDVDGRRPDWGARTSLDFSMFPSSFLTLYRRGLELQRDWLHRVTANTERALSQLPAKRVATGRARKATSRRREPGASRPPTKRTRQEQGPRKVGRSR
jgi:NAD(P)-dependent dehydrogenase (short-subunit alcohol dehydrogenase family)